MRTRSRHVSLSLYGSRWIDSKESRMVRTRTTMTTAMTMMMMMMMMMDGWTNGVNEEEDDKRGLID